MWFHDYLNRPVIKVAAHRHFGFLDCFSGEFTATAWTVLGFVSVLIDVITGRVFTSTPTASCGQTKSLPKHNTTGDVIQNLNKLYPNFLLFYVQMFLSSPTNQWSARVLLERHHGQDLHSIICYYVLIAVDCSRFLEHRSDDIIHTFIRSDKSLFTSGHFMWLDCHL